jgi:hypothetical protein
MAAEAHARACARCRDALGEGARLVALLREALPLPAPSPDALARAALAIKAETAAERARARRLTWASAGAMAVAWLFQLSVGSGFAVSAVSLAVSLAVLGVAIVGVTLLRARARLAVPLMVASSGTFAWAVRGVAGLRAAVGLRCSFRELWAAAIASVIIGAVARRSGTALSRRNVTTIAAASALAAQAGQNLACAFPRAGAHVLVFHFGAVVLATALGAITPLSLVWRSAQSNTMAT